MHFLLLPSCFQKASFPEVSKGVIVWERVNLWFVNASNFDKVLTISVQKRLNSLLEFSNFKIFPYDKSNSVKEIIFVLERVQNIMGKEENAGYKHFLLFPQCFLNVCFQSC